MKFHTNYSHNMKVIDKRLNIKKIILSVPGFGQVTPVHIIISEL